VSRYTKYDVAVSCNHDPMLENNKPAKYKRALKKLSERNMPREATAVSVIEL
jgi:hypothetical protein